MKRPTRKQLIWFGGGALLLAALVYGFLPDPVPVQTAVVERAPLEVSVEEEGTTRVVEHFVVTAPVAGYLRRIEVAGGDPVAAGQPLASLEAPRAADLDPRTQAGTAARAEAARAAVAAAEEQARAAETVAQQAEAERERTARLVEAEAATRQALDRAEAEARQAAAARDAARAAAAAARADLAAARAAGAPAAEGSAVRQVIRAPAAGRVLSVHRRDAGPVQPGEPLLEIGDTGALEAVVDVLSQDAVRIPHGARVVFEQWGGDDVLTGTVRRVEPGAFTRVSALGVEEQRVRVVVALDEGSAPSGLGSGYRVLARFVLWEGASVLQVPTGALFRSGGSWAVFTAENGRAVHRTVSIGHRAGLAAEVVSGLPEGSVVIVHPDDRVAAGVRVRPR